MKSRVAKMMLLIGLITYLPARALPDYRTSKFVFQLVLPSLCAWYVAKKCLPAARSMGALAFVYTTSSNSNSYLSKAPGIIAGVTSAAAVLLGITVPVFFGARFIGAHLLKALYHY